MLVISCTPAGHVTQFKVMRFSARNSDNFTPFYLVVDFTGQVHYAQEGTMPDLLDQGLPLGTQVDL